MDKVWRSTWTQVSEKEGSLEEAYMEDRPVRNRWKRMAMAEESVVASEEASEAGLEEEAAGEEVSEAVLEVVVASEAKRTRSLQVTETRT